MALKVSLITVVLNAASEFQHTLRSVKKQKYDNIEYIVVDGGSTDGTIDVAISNINYINKLITEPDRGIYDAMNKGIASSTGDVLYFLNAGDVFASPNVLNRFQQPFSYSTTDIVFGDLNMVDGKGNLAWRKCYHCLDRYIMCINSIEQQAVFFRKSAFDRYGYFDPSYPIAGDAEWLLRAMRVGLTWTYIREPVADFALGGISSNTERNMLDRMRLLKIYFSSYERSFYSNRLLQRVLFNRYTRLMWLWLFSDKGSIYVPH